MGTKTARQRTTKPPAAKAEQSSGLIARARRLKTDGIEGRLGVLGLAGLSLLLCSLLFPPVDWWWLGWVCLTPWWVAVCAGHKRRTVYLASWLLGAGFFLVHVRWLYPLTPPGYFLLCAGYGLCFPLAAWPIRHMWRRHRAPVALVGPIVWVAVEYLRSIGPLGFPWALLGHSQYEILTMIQISDLVGAYGVSFVLAMVSGLLVDLLLRPARAWRVERMTRLPLGWVSTFVVVAGTLVYGVVRKSPSGWEPGPKVAVVQHDFVMRVDQRGGRTTEDMVQPAYLELAGRAAAEKPDLIVLPETAIALSINDEFVNASAEELEEIRQRRYPTASKSAMPYFQTRGRQARDAFQTLCTGSGVPIVLGFSSLEWKPTELPPRVEGANSAFLMEPGKFAPVARYDKMHLVLFGEYVPFRYRWPSIYHWLNSWTPWGANGGEYSLTPGSEFAVFEFDAASRNKRRYRAGVPICYEEIMPYIAREFVRGDGEAMDKKNIDMLLTISNDGWFLHSAEVEQHLMSAVFRAVENRIPVARSVNTGTSGHIYPNGEIQKLVTLSPETLERLEPVAAALRNLKTLAEKLGDGGRIGPAYGDAVDKLKQACRNDLRGSVDAVGREYSFFFERQWALLASLLTTDIKERQDAVRALHEQLDDDLETIARWNARPWTGPGYVVATLQQDDRITLYSRWGDWFSQGAMALMGLMLFDSMLRRVFRRKRVAAEPEA